MYWKRLEFVDELYGYLKSIIDYWMEINWNHFVDLVYKCRREKGLAAEIWTSSLIVYSFAFSNLHLVWYSCSATTLFVDMSESHLMHKMSEICTSKNSIEGYFCDSKVTNVWLTRTNERQCIVITVKLKKDDSYPRDRSGIRITRQFGATGWQSIQFHPDWHRCLSNL